MHEHQEQSWTLPCWFFITAFFMLLGGTLYRFSVCLIGFNREKRGGMMARDVLLADWSRRSVIIKSTRRILT